MERRRENCGIIRLVGIKGRTNNAREMEGNGLIPEMVSQWYNGPYMEQIKHHSRPTRVLAVYTEYESDESGEYTYFIGCEVDELKDIPDGLHTLEIPAASYEVLTTGPGSLPSIVLEAWGQIWNDQDLKKKRAYTFDFEVYGKPARDPGHAVVELFIAIKSES